MRSKGSRGWKHFPFISIFVFKKNFVPLRLCAFVSKSADVGVFTNHQRRRGLNRFAGLMV
jgi:hypothetical protein